PSLFSTTTLWPHSWPSLSAIMRPTTSVVPPAENGTTILTGLVGQSAAAAVATTPSDRPAAARALARQLNVPLENFICLSIIVDTSAPHGRRHRNRKTRSGLPAGRPLRAGCTPCPAGHGARAVQCNNGLTPFRTDGRARRRGD